MKSLSTRIFRFRVNTRKIWETINELRNNKTEKDSTTLSILHNKQIKNTLEQISDAFNDYFSNVAPELASKLSSAQISHKPLLY